MKVLPVEMQKDLNVSETIAPSRTLVCCFLCQYLFVVVVCMSVPCCSAYEMTSIRHPVEHFRTFVRKLHAAERKGKKMTATEDGNRRTKEK